MLDQLTAVYYVPAYLPLEGFAAIAYLKFKELTPKKSGNMAAYDDYDYDVDNRLVYLFNTCEYGAYQNYETANIGWFDESTDTAFQYALRHTPRLEKGKEELDWYQLRRY